MIARNPKHIDAMPKAALKPIIKPGTNCWRVVRADKAAVVVDAASYYHFVREAFEQAEQRILIIGWDFDTRIALEPDKHGKGEPLGKFFLRLAKANPERQIDILKWSFGALKQFAKPRAVFWLWRWKRSKAIDFRFDSAHPPGCSHHQKIVVIDDSFAVCGGIDIAKGRWDTCDHKDDDPRRTDPDGKQYTPWHDITMLMGGEAAAALGELGRDRWHVATKEKLKPVPPSEPHWPKDVEVMFENVDIAIARTRAKYERVKEVREIETLYIDMISAAKNHVYIENQYLTSAKIAAAIAKRLEEKSPPEFVIVMPRTADGWLEQKAMDAARVQLARAMAKVDHAKRFRIYVPVTKGGADIYVHAKLSIVDDRFLRIGSSNMNNRSLGLDSECDVAIDTALPANKHCGPAIAALRTHLIAEHIGVEDKAFDAALKKSGSLIDTIEKLSSKGRRLELLDLEKPGPFDQFIAENELLDPEHADGFTEPLHARPRQTLDAGQGAVFAQQAPMTTTMCALPAVQLCALCPP